jgi:predicted Zn finger-like uncharacterized protein
VPIEIQCAACGTAFRVSDGAAGKRVKCRTCGGAIQVPPDNSPPASAAFPPDLLSSPNLLTPPASSQPLNWGGAGYYMDSHGSAPARSRMMIALAALGLVWAGFVLCDSVDRIGDLWPFARSEQAVLFVRAALCVFLRSVQTACLLAVVVAIAAMMQRRTWGAPLGAIVSTANTGISATWVTLLSSMFGMAIFLRGTADSEGDLPQFGVRVLVDIVTFLVIPALLVLGFRRQISLKSWKKKGRASAWLLAAITLGWSISAIVELGLTFAVYNRMAEVVDVFEFGGRRDVVAKFWGTMVARAGCILAAVVLIGAAVGIFLRQHWAILTTLIASGAYVVLTIVATAVEASIRSRGMAFLNVIRVTGMIVSVIPPVAIAIWCLMLKDEEE